MSLFPEPEYPALPWPARDMADLAASVAHARGVSVHEMLKQTKGSLPLTQLVHALVKDHKQSPARVDQKWGLPHGTAARLLREPDPRPDAPVLRLVPPAPESEAPRRYMSEEHKEKIRQAHLRNNAKREFSQAHKDALSTAQRARWAAEREDSG